MANVFNIGDGMMIQANVCATFNFAANGLGFINRPGTYETFQWSLKNDSLKIFNNPKNSVTTFFDTVYTQLLQKKRVSKIVNKE
jgi:hypothetical protein